MSDENDTMDEMEEVIQEFLYESAEALDRMDNDLIALETDPSNRELIASIFRGIHTIKGTCGFLGYSKLESVTHTGENLLGKLRDGELEIAPDITSALLALVDAVREMLSAIESTGQDGVQDYTDLIAVLTALKEGGTVPDDGSNESLSHQQPDKLEIPDEPITEAATSNINEYDGQDSDMCSEQSGTVTTDPAPSCQHTLSAAETTLRVDVNILDQLMNLVGELLLARNQLQQCTNDHRDPVFVNAVQQLNLITSELQLGIMKTRMQPINNIWNKFPRVIRDLSMKFEKQIRVEMIGRETELDKSLIEAMKDPLTHLLRNSVDHGIESPGERRKKGKTPEGTLTLHAYHEGGQVVIDIADDGAGINIEAVRQKALEQGVITREQAGKMSDREVAKLIFLPGFSTAKEVSNISGRGVGMDVVKTNIEKINGQIDLDTHPDTGTRFRIVLPLTLAITTALIVRSGGEQHAIPQTALQELVRIDGDANKAGIESIHGAPVFRLRGSLLPLISLNEVLLLGNDDTVNTDGVTIVVLNAGHARFGLLVDSVEDAQEIVVKPLSKMLQSIPEYAGATIMGDGTVALILDVMGLAQRSGVISDEQGETLNATSTGSTREMSAEKQTYVVTRIAGSGRMAIPLDRVKRLEEFSREIVEKAGDHLVVQYRGEVMPLIYLVDLLDERRGQVREEPGSDEQLSTDNLPVIVYNIEGHYVGLVVDCIVDIVEDSFVVEYTTCRRGVAGTTVIQDKVAEVLDVETVIGDIAASFGETHIIFGTGS